MKHLEVFFLILYLEIENFEALKEPSERTKIGRWRIIEREWEKKGRRDEKFQKETRKFARNRDSRKKRIQKNFKSFRQI